MPPPITPDDWRRLGSLLDRVLDADPGQRAALIAEITGGDPARQAELQQLLEECDRGLPLMDLPAVERFSSLLDQAPVKFPSGLADRYELIREVGRGGMATVFLARDLKHGRDVAVKIMRPELAASVGRERFLREIGIAAQLRHPNIVPLFDSGDADGLLYYVMPYEKGHSLRQRLARDHRLPVEEALRILRDVCDALACAHQGGIVHRDIKPDNILLTGRRALVSDFGVARAVTAAAEDTLTTAGGAPGTPAYMAPERFQGGAHVDERGDVYALGVMAFEMLVGERPLGTDRTTSGNEGGDGSVHGRVLTSRPDVPPALADVIARCLAARPEDRYRDAGEMLAALEALGVLPRRRPVFVRRWAPWPVLAAVLMLAAGVGGLLWVVNPRRSGAPASAAPRLAVLVFRHGTNPELEPLAMGLTDNLIGALGDVPGLVVRSLQAVMPYRDSLTPPDVLGRQLDVSWLVAGRLYLVGSQRIASVQLTEARTGRLIARTEAAAGAGQDVALIEAVVTRVATMLRERVGDEVRVQDWRAGTRSDAAFAAVHRAHQERREANRLAALRDVPGAWLRLRRADATLDSASRADPRWPEPLIERARVALNTASMLFGSGHSVDSVPGVLAQGISHARAALAMAPGAHRAGELLGMLLVDAAKRDPDSSSAAVRRAEAERVLREVSEADTTLVDALSVLSTMHYARGEYEQAYVLAERAYRADAFHADPQVVLSGLFTYGFEADEDAEASRWCAQYEARFPEDWYGGYCRLTLMMWAAGEAPHADTALAIAARATAAAPRVIRQSVGAQLHTLAAGVLARAGAAGQARRVLADVAATLAADPGAGREPFGSVLLEIRVGVRQRLGERDSAAVLLRQLVRLHPEQAGRYARSRKFRGVPLDSLPSAPRI
jgi:serine/threonine-protein kinase